MDRAFFVGGRIEGGKTLPFDPATDMDRLAEKAKAVGAVLLVLDPILSAVGGDSHKAAEVRRGLAPVVDLAEALGCAVLGVTHYAKGSQGRDVTERVIGSQAFGALARIVLATVASDDPGEPSRLVRSKSNVGVDGGGFEYRLRREDVAAGVTGQTVEWGGALEGGARELIAQVECPPRDDDGPGPSVSKAVEFLRTSLAEGPCRSSDVEAMAQAAGLSRSSIRRAKDEIGVRASREGGAAGTGWWTWRLPEAPMWEETI
jgi:putative DNA primase/helicase